MENESLIRESNVALANTLLKRFGRDMDGWYDHLHDDCVVEFPFAASVGMPLRVEGKTACTALFTKVCEAVKVQFSNIIVYPLADPATVLVEYNGYGEPQGLVYDQTYITIFRFQAGKIILYKEYWNSVVVRDAFGDLSGMF